MLKSEKYLKDENKFMSEFITERIKSNLDQLPFNDFFGYDVSLVPVPKSSLMKANTLWVPDKIAKELSKQGLGNYFPCLERNVPVNKAAFSKPSDRPKAIKHFETIKC